MKTPKINPDTIHRGARTGSGSTWVVGCDEDGREYGLALVFRPEDSDRWTARLSGNGIDLRLDGFATRGDAVRAVRSIYRSNVVDVSEVERLRAATVAAVANALDDRGIRDTVDTMVDPRRADVVHLTPITRDAPAYPAVAIQSVEIPGGMLEAQTDYSIRWIPDA